MTDPGFDAWMKKVDAVIEQEVGLDHRDTPDWNYRDAYDSEQDPKEAAMEALQETGWPYDLETEYW